MLRRLWLLFSQAVTVVLAAVFVLATLKPEWMPGAAAPAPLPTPTIVMAPALPAPLPVAPAASTSMTSFAAAARRATPAVVSVVASKLTRRGSRAEDPRFHEFLGGNGNSQQIGLGSGVIASAEGYLLTNNHVIEGADEIEVQLIDGRQGRATVVGTDPETDLAVLKVEIDRLPSIAFGTLASVQVGDPVLAIGNPFNVGQTVTSGIVSALGRDQLGLSTFENFIQTDAAINPGNSGGALVDASGNLIGINTAIFSRSGGSMGIGFAIPVDTARQVMEGLIRDGQVTRGWIGVEPRDLTPEIAESFGLPVREGVLITGVLANGPAARGGLKPGDVVMQVSGRPVASVSQLLSVVAELHPASETKVALQRGDKAMELTLTVGQRPKARPAVRR